MGLTHARKELHWIGGERSLDGMVGAPVHLAGGQPRGDDGSCGGGDRRKRSWSGVVTQVCP